jgi:hypothetical protein
MRNFYPEYVSFKYVPRNTCIGRSESPLEARTLNKYAVCEGGKCGLRKLDEIWKLRASPYMTAGRMF